MSDPSISNSAIRSIPQLPGPLKQYLILLDDPVGLPVCLTCQAALLPKSVLDHLRKHHQLPVGLRGDVRSLTATLPPLDFNHVPKRPDGSAPLAGLKIVDAYQCLHCPFIRRDLTDVRKHLNQSHGISAAGGYEQIRAQSWFGGRRAVYWRVYEMKDKKEGMREWEIPPCVWGFYGKGFGDKEPKAWGEGGRKPGW